MIAELIPARTAEAIHFRTEKEIKSLALTGPASYFRSHNSLPPVGPDRTPSHVGASVYAPFRGVWHVP